MQISHKFHISIISNRKVSTQRVLMLAELTLRDNSISPILDMFSNSH